MKVHRPQYNGSLFISDLNEKILNTPRLRFFAINHNVTKFTFMNYISKYLTEYKDISLWQNFLFPCVYGNRNSPTGNNRNSKAFYVYSLK